MLPFGRMVHLRRMLGFGPRSPRSRRREWLCTMAEPGPRRWNLRRVQTPSAFTRRAAQAIRGYLEILRWPRPAAWAAPECELLARAGCASGVAVARVLVLSVRTSGSGRDGGQVLQQSRGLARSPLFVLRLAQRLVSSAAARIGPVQELIEAIPLTCLQAKRQRHFMPRYRISECSFQAFAPRPTLLF